MRRPRILPFVAVIGSFTTACLDKDDDDEDGDDTGLEDTGWGGETNAGWYDSGDFEDADGDGFDAMSDCDDTDPAVNPDAFEDCSNAVDDDCDGLVDMDDTDCEGDTNAGWYADDDGDGYFDDEDCDDTDPTVYPGAPEDCEDGVDNDCDGEIDGADDDCAETGPIESNARGLDWARLGWCAPEGPVDGLRDWRRAGSPFVVDR